MTWNTEVRPFRSSTETAPPWAVDPPSYAASGTGRSTRPSAVSRTYLGPLTVSSTPVALTDAIEGSCPSCSVRRVPALRSATVSLPSRSVQASHRPSPESRTLVTVPVTGDAAFVKVHVASGPSPSEVDA